MYTEHTVVKMTGDGMLLFLGVAVKGPSVQNSIGLYEVYVGYVPREEHLETPRKVDQSQQTVSWWWQNLCLADPEVPGFNAVEVESRKE